MNELIYPAVTPFVPRAFEKAPAYEMLPIIDENGYVTGQAPRSYCHSGDKLLHPVVHLHLINRNSEIYLQQRGAAKELLPLFWDTAVGGHISYGEQVLEALYREAGEELGLHDFNPIPLTSYVFESATERELVNVFAVVGNFNPVPNGEELEGGRYWSIEEIESSIGKNVLTPNFEGEYAKVKNSLLSLL